MRSRIRWTGIRSKIIAWSFVPTALILGGVAFFVFYTYQQVTEELVFERNAELTTLLANQLSAQLQEYVQRLAFVAASTDWLTGSPATWQATLEQYWTPDHLQIFDAGVLVLDRTGRVTAAYPPRSELLGQDHSDRAYWDPTPNSPILTDIVDDGIRGANAVAVATSYVQGNNEFGGIIVGMFRAERGATRVSTFYNDIWDLYVGRGKTAYLVDSNGRVIFHPDTFLIGEDVSSQPVVREVLSGTAGTMRTRDLQGQEIVAAYAPLPGTSWSLVTEESWSTLIQASQRYNRFLLLLLALSLAAPVTVIAIGARRITIPIAELIAAAQRVAGGDLRQKIAVHTGDELETLAEQFNRMAEQLQASYATLEQRVADRTAELDALNAMAAVVSQSLDLPEILDSALEKTLQVTGLEAGAAFRLDRENQRLELIAHSGLSPAFVRHATRLALQDGVVDCSQTQVTTPVVRQVTTDEAREKEMSLLNKEGLQVVVGIPLISKKEMHGVLNLSTRTPRTIDPKEYDMLAAIGQQIGVAIENARLYEQAEVAAATRERNRLARELHDAVSQTLFSASLIADVLPRLWKRDPVRGEQSLEQLRELTRGALAEMRTLLLELRPGAIVRSDLGELLQQLAAATQSRARMAIEVHASETCDPPPEVKVTLYRIAQEAINNVVKHAHASQVIVALSCPSDIEGTGIELSIRDNGRGFDPADIPPGHMGVSIMHERARVIGARVRIESEVGQGTQITVTWPGIQETDRPTTEEKEKK